MTEFAYVQQLRDQFPAFPHAGAFLDSGASSQTPECVITAMADHDRLARANVHRSVYPLAEAATEAYESARQKIASYFGALSEREIVLTHGATAAFNLVANSFPRCFQTRPKIVISHLEHHANLVPWLMLKERGEIALEVATVTADGRIDLDDLERKANGAHLISVTHISNVTGAETDIAAITSIAKKVGAAIMLDGAQAAPHGPQNLPSLGIDFYVASSHKMYGPTGIGVLWAKEEWLQRMPPHLGGGDMVRRVTLDDVIFAPHPLKFEAGTPPITQAVGLGAAVDWLSRLDWSLLHKMEQELTKQLLNGLDDIGDVQIIGPKGTHLRRGIVSFHIDGTHPHDLCHILGEKGVSLRGGHHCAQPLVRAFDLVGTSRASLGIYNTDEDIAAFLSALQEAKTLLL